MKIKFYSFLFLLTAIFFTFCSRRNNNNHLIDVDSTQNIIQNKIYENYKIPLPIKIYKYLISNKIAINTNKLSHIDKNYKNQATGTNALFLGLYSADLAICSLSDNGQTTLYYSQICYDYANALNLGDAYDKKYLDRIKKNINNNDSLIHITNTAYNKACNYMDAKGMTNFMPFLIYAGWIEMVYQSLNFIDENEYEKIDSIIVKCKFENLVDYIYDVQVETNAYYYNKELKNIVLNLGQIQYAIKKYKKDSSQYPQLKKTIENNRKDIINGKIL